MRYYGWQVRIPGPYQTLTRPPLICSSLMSVPLCMVPKINDDQAALKPLDSMMLQKSRRIYSVA